MISVIISEHQKMLIYTKIAYFVRNYLLCTCVCLGICAHVCRYLGGWKKVSDSLELEFQVVISYLMWVLAAGHRSSVRTV